MLVFHLPVMNSTLPVADIQWVGASKNLKERLCKMGRDSIQVERTFLYATYKKYNSLGYGRRASHSI